MSISPAVAAMVWPVKSSFRSYVEGIGGRALCADGCREDADGFVFPAVGSSSPAESRFEGSVSFSAHGGLLGVVVRDPWLVHSSSETLLTVADSAGGRLLLARGPAIVPGVDTIEPVRLAADAAVLFDFTYPPETALDPVRLIAR
jgi:hypothetical protein